MEIFLNYLRKYKIPEEILDILVSMISLCKITDFEVHIFAVRIIFVNKSRHRYTIYIDENSNRFIISYNNRRIDDFNLINEKIVEIDQEKVEEIKRQCLNILDDAN